MQLFDTSSYDVPKGLSESFKTKASVAANIAAVASSMKWPDHYEVVDSPKQMKRARDLIGSAGSFIFDTETSGLNAWKDRVLGISLLVSGAVYIIPIERQMLKSVPHDAVRKYLGEAFADPSIKRINHNICFDLHFIRETFKIPVGYPYCDTLLQAKVINPDNYQSHGLKELCALYELPGAGGGNYKEQFGKTSWAYIEPKVACYYAGKDVELVHVLKAKQDEILRKKPKLEKVFWEVDMPMQHVAFDMEAKGMRVDEEYVRKVLTPTVYTEYAKATEALRPHIEPHLSYVKADDVTTVLESPTRLTKVMFDRIGLPLIKHVTLKRTPEGFTKKSLDKDAIAGLRADWPCMALLGEYRKWATVKKMFVDPLKTMIVDGRSHPSVNVNGTETARMSMSKPNLQQVPSRMGALVRNMYIPDEGNVFLSCDFSSQEMRMLAHYSNDKGLRRFFTDPDALDPYSETAIMGMKLLDPNFDERSFRTMSKEKRKQTDIYRNFKALVLGLTYGMGAAKFARSTGLSKAKAQAMYDAYYTAFPRVKWYQEQCVKFASEKGYITSLLGRERPLQGIRNQDQTLRSSAERASYNTPIQSSSADQVKVAAIQVDALIKARNWPARIALVIHDEILFEVSARWADENPECIREITSIMENALTLKVPSKSSATFEKRWGTSIDQDDLDDLYDDLIE